MSTEWFYAIQIMSTFSAALPIAASVRHWRSHSRPVVLFVCFLVLGFMVDLLGWYTFLTANAPLNENVRYVYNLVEPAFLMWLVGELLAAEPMRTLFRRGWMGVIPAWAISLYISGEAFGIFKTTTEVLISIGACYALLKITEQRKSLSTTIDFWVLLGVFFYNFSTFFIVNLINSTLGLNLWYIHNLVNVITNVIFFIGFLKSTDHRV